MGDMNEVQEYYTTTKILKFLGIDYNFEKKSYKEYPFEDKPSNIIFNWGYITIPRQGIEKIIQNKISDKDYQGILDEIKMLVHIPFYNKRTKNTGTIIVNLTVGFRYDKAYKYGDVTKSLPEVCYAIEKWGKKTNDFYIINSDYMHEFMSYFVIPTQWGIGAMQIISSPQVHINDDFKEIRDDELLKESEDKQ